MNNNLPNLSTWHRSDTRAYYTEHPVTPPLPTEEGATILASGGHWPPYILLTREGARWVNHVGDEWREREIRAWVPVALGETVVVRP